MQDHLESASHIIWNELLADRQFYALTFEKTENPDTSICEFKCQELSWIIRLYREGSRIDHKAMSESSEGYSRIDFSDRQVRTDFDQVVDVLTEEMKNMVGRPCGE